MIHNSQHSIHDSQFTTFTEMLLQTINIIVRKSFSDQKPCEKPSSTWKPTSNVKQNLGSNHFSNRFSKLWNAQRVKHDWIWRIPLITSLTESLKTASIEDNIAANQSRGSKKLKLSFQTLTTPKSSPGFEVSIKAGCCSCVYSCVRSEGCNNNNDDYYDCNNNIINMIMTLLSVNI